MKKVVIILLSTVMAALSTSCQRDDQPSAGEAFNIRLNVEGVSTRAEYNATLTGEDQINNLYLFFYDYAPDGSGSFVTCLTKDDLTKAPAMNGDYAVKASSLSGEGYTLSPSNEYVILAVANIDKCAYGKGYIGNDDIEMFISSMGNITEKEATQEMTALVTGYTEESYVEQSISKTNLLMSARVVKQTVDKDIEINLIRTLARFDVFNLAQGHVLVSASIWGATSKTTLWSDRMLSVPSRMQRFYGVETAANMVHGGLYAFENYVANPIQNDQVTTCLLLGLRNNKDGKVYYYRVNINKDGKSQNIERNHVYKININNVSELGADSEYNAWSQSKSLLNVTVVDWGLDPNGMVLTDGTNTMMLPVKLESLDPLGEVSENTVYTIGSETLYISQRSLPIGITANLIGGTLLQVKAEPLPTDPQTGKALERRGSIELAYGSLRGIISFVQTPDNTIYLSLSRYEIPDHAPLGRGGITDNTPLVVTASGPWTATITNIPLDGISTDFNPGFSFSSSSIETVLKSGDNSFGDLFQIYTTGDNTSVSETRHGFLMVTLDEDPETYNSIVALTQATKQDVVITPTLPATLRYSAVGAPVGISGATAEQGYTFDINPGKTAGVTNTWDVVAAGGNAEYFEIVKTPTPFDPNSPVQRFTIKAKGTTDHTQYPYNSNRHMNMTFQPLTASFAVKYGASSPETVDQYISIVQDPMGISVSTQGTNVPKTGGHIQDVTINIGEGLHWIAEIKAADNFTSANSNVSLTHHAYLLIDSNDDGIMERQTGAITTHQLRTKKLSVGFDKIYYPMIDESPKATVMVSLAENPSVNTTFTVTQDKLTAAPMNILDVKASSWGNLTGPTHYISAYREYLNNSRLFGPTGKVKTSAIKITGNAPATISGDYSYVHVGGQPEYYSQTTHTAVNDWWNSYGKERLLLYVSDNRLSHLFAGSTSAVALQRKTVLSTLGIKYGQPSSAPKVNSASSATSTQVYDYIINDGPFGAVGSVSTLNFAWDALSTAPDNLPASAVKMLVDGGGERPFLFIDPENNLVYFGECLMFDTTHISAANMAAGNFSGTYANRSKFMANMLAYIVNAAQYGSHFTDLFIFTPSGIEAVKERSGGHTPQELYNDAFHE